MVWSSDQTRASKNLKAAIRTSTSGVTTAQLCSPCG